MHGPIAIAGPYVWYSLLKFIKPSDIFPFSNLSNPLTVSRFSRRNYMHFYLISNQLLEEKIITCNYLLILLFVYHMNYILCHVLRFFVVVL